MSKDSLRILSNKIAKIIRKNNVVLRDHPTLIRSEKNKVNINAWINLEKTHNNVGDYLSLVIVQEILKEKNINIGKTVSKTKHLYGVGSVLLGYQDATIWGSGFVYDVSKYRSFKLEAILHKVLHKTDIRAVRGPETKRILEKMGLNCPETYGDPAILLPRFYSPDIAEKKPFVVVPHYTKYDRYKGLWPTASTFVREWKQAVDAICQAEFVISSSLHGIIIAEAYGIPAVMLKDTPSTDITKYKDWYEATGRKELPIVSSVEEALEKYESGKVLPPPLKIIETLAEGLMSAFPYDLWEVDL